MQLCVFGSSACGADNISCLPITEPSSMSATLGGSSGIHCPPVGSSGIHCLPVGSRAHIVDGAAVVVQVSKAD